MRYRFLGQAVGAMALLAACGSGSETPISAASQTSTTVPVVDVARPSSTVVESVTVPDEAAVANEPEELGLTAVSAADVEAALSGNTIVGNWVGENYRQFFDPNGTTTYQSNGGSESVGQWRINTDNDQYESLWAPSPTWDVYDVFRDGDQWFWTGGGVELSPFTIVEGQ